MPITERSAVRASASIATSKFLTLKSACLASHDLREDGRVDRDDDVVLRDHVLTVAGNGNLAHVDWAERVDERNHHDEARLVRLAVLAEALQHADLTLLHDVDGGLQRARGTANTMTTSTDEPGRP